MLTKSQKKYLFAIYMLGQEGGAVKSTTVSDVLGVSKASTVKMTQKLIEEQYIIKEPYREIRLTSKGVREANKLFTPSVILRNFLRTAVDVPDDKAREAGMVMATELDEDILEKLVQYCLSLA
ncbi:MAG: metal-dependent transcriptional regulator [Ruminococcus sp.]|nr:metal-dependent transcriptional regulator [Ruminococcus sp.]